MLPVLKGTGTSANTPASVRFWSWSWNRS